MLRNSGILLVYCESKEICFGSIFLEILTRRNFSEDLILALLARLLSSLKLRIANNTSDLDTINVYEVIIQNR